MCVRTHYIDSERDYNDSDSDFSSDKCANKQYARRTSCHGSLRRIADLDYSSFLVELDGAANGVDEAATPVESTLPIFDVNARQIPDLPKAMYTWNIS